MDFSSRAEGQGRQDLSEFRSSRRFASIERRTHFAIDLQIKILAKGKLYNFVLVSQAFGGCWCRKAGSFAVRKLAISYPVLSLRAIVAFKPSYKAFEIAKLASARRETALFLSGEADQQLTSWFLKA